MVSTQKAGNVVSQVRSLATRIVELYADINNAADRYNRNGGQAFLHPFFLDADGLPRTDLDITEAQIVTCISNMTQMTTWLNAKMDVFIQAE